MSAFATPQAPNLPSHAELLDYDFADLEDLAQLPEAAAWDTPLRFDEQTELVTEVYGGDYTAFLSDVYGSLRTAADQMSAGNLDEGTTRQLLMHYGQVLAENPFSQPELDAALSAMTFALATGLSRPNSAAFRAALMRADVEMRMVTTSPGRPGNLTSNGHFSNIYPSDQVVLLTTPRTLIQENGRYWLVSGSGTRVTPSGSYDFVTLPNGSILVARPNSTRSSLHSTHLGLSGGSEVAYAGSIVFTNNSTSNRGQIMGWSNNSGHYRPPASYFENAGLPGTLFFPSD